MRGQVVVAVLARSIGHAGRDGVDGRPYGKSNMRPAGG